VRSERSKAITTLRLLAAAALMGCGICGPGPQPPPTDTCASPQTGNVTSVELAAPQLDGRRFGSDTAQDELKPRLLGSGDVVWRIRGGQGAEMVPVRLVYRGPDVPACVAQDTLVTVGGQLAARNRDNVATYELEPGARATKTFWLPGAYEQAGTLTTDSAGKKAELSVRTVPFDSCESVLECPCSFALYVTDSGVGLSDAGARLWSAYQSCLSSGDAGCQTACAAHLY